MAKYEVENHFISIKTFFTINLPNFQGAFAVSATMKKVLISGGTGLVGEALQNHLKSAGNSVHVLTRTPSVKGQFFWNPETKEMDIAAFEGVDSLVHLAGAGIADKPWTPARKQIIIDSRTKSSATLLQAILKHKIPIKNFVSASAIGFYGSRTDGHKHVENEPAASDFLGYSVKKWEQSTSAFRNEGIRTVQLRIGVVLAKNGGALQKMTKVPILSPLGSGKQYIPFIHIDDLCKMFLFAIENKELNSVYNAVATEQINNKRFTQILAKKVKKIYLGLPVPAFVLKLVLGEMACIVLDGNAIRNDKILETGFSFQFDDAESALENIYSTIEKT